MKRSCRLFIFLILSAILLTSCVAVGSSVSESQTPATSPSIGSLTDGSSDPTAVPAEPVGFEYRYLDGPCYQVPLKPSSGDVLMTPDALDSKEVKSRLYGEIKEAPKIKMIKWFDEELLFRFTGTSRYYDEHGGFEAAAPLCNWLDGYVCYDEKTMIAHVLRYADDPESKEDFQDVSLYLWFVNGTDELYAYSLRFLQGLKEETLRKDYQVIEEYREESAFRRKYEQMFFGECIVNGSAPTESELRKSAQTILQAMHKDPAYIGQTEGDLTMYHKYTMYYLACDIKENLNFTFSAWFDERNESERIYGMMYEPDLSAFEEVATASNAAYLNDAAKEILQKDFPGHTFTIERMGWGTERGELMLNMYARAENGEGVYLQFYQITSP